MLGKKMMRLCWRVQEEQTRATPRPTRKLSRLRQDPYWGSVECQIVSPARMRFAGVRANAVVPKTTTNGQTKTSPRAQIRTNCVPTEVSGWRPSPARRFQSQGCSPPPLSHDIPTRWMTTGAATAEFLALSVRPRPSRQQPTSEARCASLRLIANAAVCTQRVSAATCVVEVTPASATAAAQQIAGTVRKVKRAVTVRANTHDPTGRRTPSEQRCPAGPGMAPAWPDAFRPCPASLALTLQDRGELSTLPSASNSCWAPQFHVVTDLSRPMLRGPFRQVHAWADSLPLQPELKEERGRAAPSWDPSLTHVSPRQHADGKGRRREPTHFPRSPFGPETPLGNGRNGWPGQEMFSGGGVGARRADAGGGESGDNEGEAKWVDADATQARSAERREREREREKGKEGEGAREGRREGETEKEKEREEERESGWGDRAKGLGRTSAGRLPW